MERRDHTTFCEWLSLEVDGELTDSEARELNAHVAECAECRHEREQLQALSRAFADARLDVRPDFRERVMTALPAAGWEARAARGWAVPAALAAALAICAMLFLGHGPDGSASAAGVAVVGMLSAALTAGAGLLNASWKGVGMVVQVGLASRLSLIVFGVLVASLNLLLISLIRRRHPAAAGSRSR
jgi:anti-sigma factor RsiW